MWFDTLYVTLRIDYGLGLGTVLISRYTKHMGSNSNVVKSRIFCENIREVG